jgi:hypothetical protein
MDYVAKESQSRFGGVPRSARKSLRVLSLPRKISTKQSRNLISKVTKEAVILEISLRDSLLDILRGPIRASLSPHRGFSLDF